MPTEPHRFWERVRERWSPESEAELHLVARSVLFHLRRRLPAHEAHAVFGSLPGEVVRLAFTPQSVYDERREDTRPLESHEDIPDFYETVAHEADTSKETAEQATRALFAAIRQDVPENHVRAVEAMLPKGLKAVWSEARHPNPLTPLPDHAADGD